MNSRLGHYRRPFGIVLLALALAGAIQAASDWPEFLGPHRNGTSTETGLIRSWPKEGPPVLWTRSVGAGFSGPVVSGGRLVLFHRLNDEEVVECLDAATGKKHWQTASATAYRDDFGFDEGPRATPLVADGRVYTLGAEGHLQCLDLATGQKRWSRELLSEYKVPKGFFGVATSPLLAGAHLLINVGSKDAGIVAFHKDTGAEVWRATDHGASYSSPALATLGGNLTAVFLTREGVVIIDPASGKVRYQKHWRSRINASVNAATPVMVGDLVFVSACYGAGALLLKVTPTAVEEIWQGDDIMSNHYTTCVPYQGHLYGFDGRQEQGAHLRCVELATGKVCWTSPHAGCGSMILADGQLIILTEDGDLVLARATADQYDERARSTVLTRPCRSPLALADGRLYARDTQKLVCWSLKPR